MKSNKKIETSLHLFGFSLLGVFFCLGAAFQNNRLKPKKAKVVKVQTNTKPIVVKSVNYTGGFKKDTMFRYTFDKPNAYEIKHNCYE